VADYDPKRRRPTPVTDDDGPAPVDALLEAVEHPVASDPVETPPPSAAPVRTAGPAPLRDITPVPAPAPGAGARSLVLVAGGAALGALAALWLVARLVRRRRRR